MIHELGDAFDDRNMFLQVALGMISMSGRLDELIELYGTPAAGLSLSDGGPDPALDFVLGLVSFSRTVRGHTQAARVERRGASAPEKTKTANPAAARFDRLLR